MRLFHQLALIMIVSMMMGASIASADVITERKAGFRGNAAALKAIKGAIDTGDAAAIVSNAEKIEGWFAVMLDYFPEGSGSGDTKARPEIWTDWQRFADLATSSEAVARDLATKAKSGDMDAVRQAFKAVASTCKTCHQSFKY